MRRTRFGAVIAAIAAISMLLFSPAGQAQTRLEVGYMPILPVAQLFVMEGEGWTEEAGLELQLTRFANGPAMVQALASGKLDVMFLGIGPAMVARASGMPIKVVASNIVEQIALIARGPLLDRLEAGPAAEAVRRFTAEQGRKPKIATFPKGSVPDTVLRHWLLKVAGLGEDDVEILGMGADRVQQALLAGTVDAASTLEPILTIVQEREPAAKVVVTGSEMFPKQPGAVLAVRESVLENHRDAVRKLVALHVKATDTLRDDPARAAQYVQEFVGKGLVSQAVLEKALGSPSANFVADPRAIIGPAQRLQDFQAEIGALKKKVPLDELFDVSIYEEIVGSGR